MSSAMALSEALLPQEALSGIFGSISLATWIFLLVPQLILNYKTGRADGISLAFLIVWMVGDITNLSGAIWADLVPTVIALAIYFCIADLVLISQCLYYNHINAQRRQSSVISEHEPLLTRRRSSDTIGLPGSHRRRSSARSGTSQHSESPLSKILEENEEGTGNQWVKNSLSVLGVIVVGTAGWAIAWQAGVWKPSPLDAGLERATETALGAKILGYTSAVCYLGARIPQIVKNYKDKSCDGLALLFFLLSLMGNATYGASILCHSLERDYVMLNLPWLIGSLGTIAEDAIIFVQFRLYSTKQTTEAVVE
ncbi:putative vacuolar amino acid transporter [Lachnellula subtilissima]|uniref:Putative vacuolar amino acid transporter n=1 Tax=Lachnellula subtilissima TaxID=602034 RepID=A0A8H8RSQ4_9HELO|nr:putative vacuolar amino acid transporter [Lachnellula subtilissima]